MTRWRLFADTAGAAAAYRGAEAVIKAKYDQMNLFRLNQNIKPSS